MAIRNQGWAFISSSVGTTSPGGADTNIQFNNNGSFQGTAKLITDGSGSLSASVNISASSFYGDGSNLTGLTASAVNVADGPETAIQFRIDSPVTGEISGSYNLMFLTASNILKVKGAVSSSGDGRFGALDLDSQANVLTKTTLGSTVVNSSLTSVGTLTSLTSSNGVKANGTGIVTNNLSRSAGDLLIKQPFGSNALKVRNHSGAIPLQVSSSGLTTISNLTSSNTINAKGLQIDTNGTIGTAGDTDLLSLGSAQLTVRGVVSGSGLLKGSGIQVGTNGLIGTVSDVNLLSLQNNKLVVAGVVSSSQGITGSHFLTDGIASASHFVGNGAGLSNISAQTAVTASSANRNYELAFTEYPAADVKLGANTGLFFNPAGNAGANGFSGSLFVSASHAGNQMSRVVLGSAADGQLLFQKDGSDLVLGLKTSTAGIDLSSSNAGGIVLAGGDSAGTIVKGNGAGLLVQTAAEATKASISSAGAISGSGVLQASSIETDGTITVKGVLNVGPGTGVGYVASNGDPDTRVRFGAAGRGSDSISIEAGGKSFIIIDENGADELILGAASSDVVFVSGSLTASVGMRASASAAVGEDIIVGAGKSRTIGVLRDGSDDFFVMGHDGGAVTLSASQGVEFVGGSEGVGSFGSDIKVYATQAGNTTKVLLGKSGDISASLNVSASSYYMLANSGTIAGPSSYLGLDTSNRIVVTAGDGAGGGGAATTINVTSSTANRTYELAFTEYPGNGVKLGANTGLSFNPAGSGASGFSGSLSVSASHAGFPMSRVILGSAADGQLLFQKDGSDLVLGLKTSTAGIDLSSSNAGGIVLAGGDSAGTIVKGNGAGLLVQTAAEVTKASISSGGVVSGSGKGQFSSLEIDSTAVITSARAIQNATTISGSGLISGQGLRLDTGGQIGTVADVDLLQLGTNQLTVKGTISGSGIVKGRFLEIDTNGLIGTAGDNDLLKLENNKLLVRGVVSSSLGISGSSGKFLGLLSASHHVGNGAGLTNVPSQIAVTASTANRNYELAFTEYPGTDVKLGGSTGLFFNPAGNNGANGFSGSLTISASHAGKPMSRVVLGSDNDAQFYYKDDGGDLVLAIATSNAGIDISASNDGGIVFAGGDSAGTIVKGNGSFFVQNAAEQTKFSVAGTSGDVSAGAVSASSNISGSSLYLDNDIFLGDDQKVYFEADLGSYIESDSTDRIRFVVGGNQMLLLDEDEDRVNIGFGNKLAVGLGNNTTPSAVLHVSGTGADNPLFQVSADGSLGALFVSGSGKVGINTIAPDYTLDVAGTLGVANYIYHNGDEDTHILMQEDMINLVAGGKSIIKGDQDDGFIRINNTNANLDTQIMGNAGEVILHADAGLGSLQIGGSSPKITLDVHYTGSGNPTGLSNDTGGGHVVYFGTSSANLTAGGVYYLNANGGWESVNSATTGSGHNQLLGIALGTKPRNNGVLLKGYFDVNSFYSGSFIKGGPVYIQSSSVLAGRGVVEGGYLSSSAPTAGNSYVRIVGYGTDTANVIYFDPDATYVEIA